MHILTYVIEKCFGEVSTAGMLKRALIALVVYIDILCKGLNIKILKQHQDKAVDDLLNWLEGKSSPLSIIRH